MVLQRWQSVLLLIAAVMMGFFTFGSLGEIQYFTKSIDITTLGLKIEGKPSQGYMLQTLYVFILSLLSMMLPFIAIFSFKNLRLQKQLCLLSAVFIMITCLTEFIAVYTNDFGAQNSPGWSSLVAAPFIALVAVLVAWRCIRSDKKKLESYDRLR